MTSSKHPYAFLLFLFGTLVLLTTVVAVRAPSRTVAAASGAPVIAAPLDGSLPAGDDLYWLNPQPQGNDLLAVSCQTETVCYAITPLTILRSDDGGQRWTHVYSHADAVAGTDFYRHMLRDIHCPDENFCLAVARTHLGVNEGHGTVIRIVDGEISTAIAPGDIPEFGLHGVHCVNADVCYGYSEIDFDFIFWRSTDGGFTWERTGSIDRPTIMDFWCPTVENCLVLALSYDGGPFWVNPHILLTEDGGETWAEQWPNDDDTSGALRRIACRSATECVVAGTSDAEVSGRVLITRDGGKTWETVVDPSQGYDFYSAFCAPDGICYAIGRDYISRTLTERRLFISNADWTTWEPHEIELSLPTIGADCPAHCVLVGEDAWNGNKIVTGSGTTWQSHRTWPITDKGFQSIECPTLDRCVAVQGQFILQMDLASFSLQNSNVMTTSLHLHRISCPSAEICYATGRENPHRSEFVLAKSIDGGQTWTTQFGPLVTGASQPGMVDCPTTTFCVATPKGDSLYVTRDGGANWEEEALAVSSELRGVDCPTAETCYVLGSGAQVFKTSNAGVDWQEVTWTQPLVGREERYLRDIACFNAEHCMAAGQLHTETVPFEGYSAEMALLVTRDGGNSWYPILLGQEGVLAAIDCTASGLCMALGRDYDNSDSLSYVFSSSMDGEHWHNHESTVSHLLRDVACLGRHACLLVGARASIIGTAFTLPQQIWLPALVRDGP